MGIARILIAKVGLDGHDRGAKIIAKALRDAGFEIVYTGLHRTPEEIVNIAVEEGVDAIGISSLSGAHRYHFQRIKELLEEQKAGYITLFGGGIIPSKDVKILEKMGVKKIFLPGSKLSDIIKWVKDNIKPHYILG